MMMMVMTMVKDEGSDNDEVLAASQKEGMTLVQGSTFPIWAD
jgi:hypothetical protein